MSQKVLQLNNVSKTYGGRTVCNVPDLAIGKYPIEGLIGPNGAGKSTLINLITHKVSADQGQILFYRDSEEIDISNMSLDSIARLGLVRTNQVIQDFDSLTIMDSLLLSLANSKYEKFYAIFKDDDLRRSVKEEIQEYLDYFHFEDPKGHALSAGEKKLLDIIRCMLLKPKFLLMDEPTAGLPQDLTDKVMELMKRKTNEEGMRILIVEHDLDLIWNVCENVYFMSEGEMLIEGPPCDIRQNQLVINKYMGEKNA